jgi:putative ABC transport system permease protein
VVTGAGRGIGAGCALAGLLVWYRSDLSALSRVPWVNLIVILAGLPVLAAVGGWLLAGREPPTMTRPPLE